PATTLVVWCSHRPTGLAPMADATSTHGSHNVRDYGVFVELEPGVTGLIHSSRLPLGFAKLEQFAFCERVVVDIIEVLPVRRRIDLAYAGTPKQPSLADVGQMAFDLPSDSGSDQMV